MMIMDKYLASDAGCWFDSARGIYIGEEVIALAEGHGLKIAEEDQTNRTPEGEGYHELWDEAEDYLQDFAPEGFYFGSNEGDWGLWPAED